MAQPDTKALSAHVPLPSAEQAEQMAARLERSRGWIVKQALLAWIDQEEQRNRLSRDAMAGLNAGHHIDQQAIQAWAESLGSEVPLPVPR